MNNKFQLLSKPNQILLSQSLEESPNDARTLIITVIHGNRKNYNYSSYNFFKL